MITRVPAINVRAIPKAGFLQLIGPFGETDEWPRIVDLGHSDPTICITMGWTGHRQSSLRLLASAHGAGEFLLSLAGEAATGRREDTGIGRLFPLNALHFACNTFSLPAQVIPRR